MGFACRPKTSAKVRHLSQMAASLRTAQQLGWVLSSSDGISFVRIYPFSSSLPLPHVMAKSKSYGGLIVLLIIIAAVAGGGWYYFQNKGDKQPEFQTTKVT